MTIIKDKISDDEFILSSKCWDFTIEKNNDATNNDNDNDNDNDKKNVNDIFQEIIKKLEEDY